MKTLNAEEIPQDQTAREFIESLDLTEDILVAAEGEPCAVIVSPREYQERQHAKRSLFRVIDQIRSQNPDADSDAVLAELGQADALTA
jgi:hypothetical protein